MPKQDILILADAQDELPVILLLTALGSHILLLTALGSHAFPTST